jgi:hypothetical protein
MDIAAITCLESTSYFQNKGSVNEYLDKFLDLISEAGYTDNKTIVVKFHRGLDPHIQDFVAIMTSGCPSKEILFQWYNSAWTLDQNRATNEAFQSSYHVPTSHPNPTQICPPVPNVTCPSINVHFHPSPGNTIPMDLDAARRKATLLISYYCCRKAGHKSTDCDLHFKIRACTVDELQGFLEDKLAALDVVAEEDDVTVEEDKPKEKDFAVCNECIAHPPCQLTIILMFYLLSLVKLLKLLIKLCKIQNFLHLLLQLLYSILNLTQDGRDDFHTSLSLQLQRERPILLS